ncbi:GDSL-type esterase/lipase family protein [Magnetospirillum sp. LM-5]|uniref:SGNH/GDSL hydrolase family protein n=1 Tax=Magnetospirillum sp. LM-5 TaxID=2681466 RepID=UPI0020C5637C|nr:GDSL-type esterase/lipase family protein [Magnetospirillum sp. LM-5]
MIVLAGAELCAVLVERLAEPLMDNPVAAQAFGLIPDLDSYEMMSPTVGRHWVLRPGYGRDSSDIAREKAESGRELGAAAARQGATSGMRLEINEQGFKGGPLDPLHRRSRILVLGDSVTFGYAGIDYVRAFETGLRQRSLDVEVVNGGVEGYAIRNHLLELDRYLALDPDMVAILIGWNDLFALTGSEGTLWQRFATGRMADKAVRYLEFRSTSAVERAQALRDKPKRVDATASDLRRYAELRPAFLDRLERLANAFAGSGAQVVLLTLPGLYRADLEPTAEALRLGHLPAFTDNPMVLAVLAEGYNRAVAQLGRRHGWRVVDTAAWAEAKLVPPENFFIDSVHMTGAAYAMLGEFLAGELADQVHGLPQSAGGGKGP